MNTMYLCISHLFLPQLSIGWLHLEPDLLPVLPHAKAAQRRARSTSSQIQYVALGRGKLSTVGDMSEQRVPKEAGESLCPRCGSSQGSRCPALGKGCCSCCVQATLEIKVWKG